MSNPSASEIYSRFNPIRFNETLTAAGLPIVKDFQTTSVCNNLQVPLGTSCGNDSSSGNNSLSAGGIAGVVIGSVVGAIILLLVILWIVRSRKQSSTGASPKGEIVTTKYAEQVDASQNIPNILVEAEDEGVELASLHADQQTDGDMHQSNV
jgi:hypothetical protein